MIRSLLVALDDTPGALAAREAAIALARRTGAALTAAAILDRRNAADENEPVPLGAAAFKERRDAARVRRAEAEADRALEQFAASAQGLAFDWLRLADAPEPALLHAGAGHDLIVIGRDSTLGQEEADENSLAPVIEALLRGGGRPLLVVPPGPPAPPPSATGPVLVGYDGSVPAMRALQLFALLGLAEGGVAEVLSVAEDPAEAQRLAMEAAAFLRRHDIGAEAVGLGEDGGDGAAPAAARLLARARAMPARLMVLGAFGRTGLRSLFLGSATRQLLRDAPCPLFIHH